MREFVNSEVLLKIEEDPLETSKQLDDILVGEVLAVGQDCVKYNDWVGKKVLIKRQEARDLRQPYFDVNEKIALHEKMILCKYLK